MVTYKRNIRVKGSTLVEVIVAMVILLVIFGIGMTIFANLFRSSTSLDNLAIRQQLTSIRHHYLDNSLDSEQMNIENIRYTIVTQTMDNFPDLYILKIYATHSNEVVAIDSLVSIHEITDKVNHDFNE